MCTQEELHTSKLDTGAQVAALREALGSVVEDTVGNVEKKQARTYEELQAEQAEADEARRPLQSYM